MHIAVDTVTDCVVTGPEVTAARSQTTTETDKYECLFCEESLTYCQSSTNADRYNQFCHQGSGCFAPGNASHWHRIGQELVSKRLCNWLPLSPTRIDIDVEKRVGSQSEYIVADVRITHPVKLAVEVVFLTSVVDLRRRLTTLFQEGYDGMLFVLTNADVSPARIENHLQSVGGVNVGRIDPRDGVTEVGSVLTPNSVDLSPTAWDSMPAYLA